MPLNEPASRAALERVVASVAPGARLVRAWPLVGGVSATVIALEIERADGTAERLVLRRHGAADLARNPQIARDEFRLLQRLHGVGLPVPRPLAVDEAGAWLGQPALVLAFIEGEPLTALAEGGNEPEQLGAALAAVHRAPLVGLDFLPDRRAQLAARLTGRPTRLDESLREGAIRAALEAAWPWPQRSPFALLHGDFWSGNSLWRDGRLVAVIDWEDAARGDPLSDVGNARLELLWAFGEDAMTRFTEAYAATSAADLSTLPQWDLVAALRAVRKLGEWKLDPTTEARFRERLVQFVEQALDGEG